MNSKKLNEIFERQEKRWNKYGEALEEHTMHMDIEFLMTHIEELEAEKKRLFDAHSVEMVRADKLQQELERDRAYYKRLSENHAQAGEDDAVVIEALQAEVERLQKTVSEFLDAISGVPMRAIDCDQEEVDRLWRTLEKAVCHINVIVNDHINVE